jgi:GH24 family phage-related lysozyme (muramidase)
MRKILTIIALIFTAILPSKAGCLHDLPPFERAVLIIKHYETLHRPIHWPYIGYGHQVQPGEPYRKGVQLTEKQADALLRRDLHKFCALYREFGADSLLLACVSYNCGPGRIQNSQLLRKLKAGRKDVFAEYLSFCHYNGRVHPGIRRRRYVEYQLLKNQQQ